jgi:hypothetical protein
VVARVRPEALPLPATWAGDYETYSELSA